MLSTISGTPFAWATSASLSMSQMLPAGLPTLSQKIALVLASTTSRTAIGELSFANGLYPKSRSMLLNNVCV